MTYKYYKKEGWVGFCNGCEQPFAPMIVDASEFHDDNKKRKHFKMILSRQDMNGWCRGCCESKEPDSDADDEEDNKQPGRIVLRKIKEKELIVRKVCKVMVV